VKPFLLRQVASPVRWTECMQRLAAEGATAFVEVGPGRVLTGLVRRILDGARGHSVEDVAGLDKAMAAVGASA
jgi:[acyl-carrier-protein] S-malonyltransferase